MTRLFLVLAFLIPLAAKSEPYVDVELVVAVDVSYSVSTGEGDIQRIGYAAAFENPEVIAAMTGGLHGQVAVTYVEWADEGFQRQIIPWRLIRSRNDAHALAKDLRNAPIARSGATSISSALTYAAALIESNQWQGVRRVIDLSGDGPNNEGLGVAKARDQVLAKGITINGLPLSATFASTAEDLDLEAYFRDCVIGGPGAFALSVDHWDRFQDALQNKLVLELAGISKNSIRFAKTQEAVDCLYGERAQRRKLKEELDRMVPGGRNRWITDDDL